MSSCVCKISFESVQVCGGCCKMFRGLTFGGHSVCACVCEGADVLDICATTRRVTSAGGELTSPRYPAEYPPAADCTCTLSADDPAARLQLSIYDLVLRTKHDRCRADWLMLRQGAYDWPRSDVLRKMEVGIRKRAWQRA